MDREYNEKRNAADRDAEVEKINAIWRKEREALIKENERLEVELAEARKFILSISLKDAGSL